MALKLSAHRMCLGAAFLLLAASGVMACRGGAEREQPTSTALTLSSQAYTPGAIGTNELNPPPATPRAIRTEENPGSDAKALELATDDIAALPGSNQRSANITFVSFVRTDAADAAAFLHTDLGEGISPDAKAWVFVAYGDFAEDSAVTGRGPTMHTQTVFVMEGLTIGVSHLSNEQYDLTKLGAPVIIQPGDAPAIDTVRAH